MREFKGFWWIDGAKSDAVCVLFIHKTALQTLPQRPKQVHGVWQLVFAFNVLLNLTEESKVQQDKHVTASQIVFRLKLGTCNNSRCVPRFPKTSELRKTG